MVTIFHGGTSLDSEQRSIEASSYWKRRPNHSNPDEGSGSEEEIASNAGDARFLKTARKIKLGTSAHRATNSLWEAYCQNEFHLRQLREGDASTVSYCLLSIADVYLT